MTDTKLHRIGKPHHSPFVERAMVTYRAFEAIDETYPVAKFTHENAAWSHNVHEILGHEKMSNEDKIDALETLIIRVKASVARQGAK